MRRKNEAGDKLKEKFEKFKESVLCALSINLIYFRLHISTVSYLETVLMSAVKNSSLI